MRSGLPVAWCLVALVGCGGRGEPPPSDPTGEGSTEAPVAPPAPRSARIGVARGGGPWAVEVTLHDEVDARRLGGGCVGRVGLAPDWEVEVADAGVYTATVVPIGSPLADLTLALRAPDGSVRCSDDEVGLSPRWSGEFAAGRWQVFVGTQTPGAGVRARMRLFEGPPSKVPAAQVAALPPPVFEGPMPTPLRDEASGANGGLRLARGTGPGTVTGVGGGPRDASRLGPGCAGLVGDGPDHLLEVEAAMELTIRVDAEADTSLVVVGPRERVLCDDDTVGLSPAIRARLEPGRYSVYVGSHEETQAPRYVLTVSR